MTIIELKAIGYKRSDLDILHFVECKDCGHTVVRTNTKSVKLKTLVLDPVLGKDDSYHLHHCMGKK